MLSDLHLRRLQRLIAGRHDRQAYKQVFLHFFPRVRRFVLQLTGSAETAEEIAADTLLQVWLKRETLPEITNLSAWLYVSARNRALNLLNKPERTNFFFLELTDMDYVLQTADPEQDLIFRETLALVNQAIAELPPKCRMIFRLIREDGLRYKEVARILNISVNTVDAQMTIAVKRILKRAGYAKSKPGRTISIIPMRKKN